MISDSSDRDISPTNLLFIEDENPRWVVADWVMVTRPPGETTAPRTSVGRRYGTHGVCNTGDVWPSPTMQIIVPIFTASGDHRVGEARQCLQPVRSRIARGTVARIVRRCTAVNRDDRPQTIAELLTMVERISIQPEQTPLEQAESLQSELQAGDVDAVKVVVDLARANPDDLPFYLKAVVTIPNSAVSQITRDNQLP